MPSDHQSRRPNNRIPPSRSPEATRSPKSGRQRFLEWDDYRADREWKRFEGTPLRDLYRQLRERFLRRHRPLTPGRTLDVGPGPGRFTRLVSGPTDRIAVLELSRAMLTHLRENERESRPELDLVQADAVDPPFRPGSFHRVGLLGNVLGFAEEDAPKLLTRAARLVGAGGSILVEFVSGPGERSRYLHRLPTGAVARLLAAPLRAIEPRVVREGFDTVRPERARESRFRRFPTSEVEALLRWEGLIVRETLAVAPCLGNDPSKLTEVRNSPAAWERLLELEEGIGGRPERRGSAAALLIAAVRAERGPVAAPMRTVK